LSETNQTSSRFERFTQFVVDRCQKDKGFAARLRRAANPDTEYQSWEFLAQWTNLEWADQRLPFATIASAIAASDAKRNGSLTLGQAITKCYEDGRESDAAKAKLRRLLACSEVVEVCRILRPLLKLIQSRVLEPLDYVRLLSQVWRFRYTNSIQRTRAEWAQEFYGRAAQTDGQEAT
jgi:CRISPR system Cascade subunit CasB